MLSKTTASAAWLEFPRNADYSKKEVHFDGISREYPAFKQYFRQLLGTSQLSNLMGPMEHRPQVETLIALTWQDPEVDLNAQIIVPGFWIPLTSEERQFNMKARTINLKVMSQYQQALSLLSSKLGSTPKSVISAYLRDDLQSVEVNFHAAIAALDRKYASTPLVTVAEMKNRLESCPEVLNLADAEVFISVLNETALDISSVAPAENLTENFKRTLVLQKFGPIFQNITDFMCGTSDDAAWSFDKISFHIKGMQDRDRLRHARFGSSHSPNSSSVPAHVPVSSDTVAAAPSLINFTAGSGPVVKSNTCKNCGSASHFIRDCESMCKLCPTPSVPHLHHPMDCPAFKRSRQYRSQDSQSSAGRSPNNGRSRGSVPPKRSTAPSENLYSKVKQRRVVNQVRGEFYADEEDDDDFGDDPYGDSDYLPDSAFNFMVVADLTVLSRPSLSPPIGRISKLVLWCSARLLSSVFSSKLAICLKVRHRFLAPVTLSFSPKSRFSVVGSPPLSSFSLSFLPALRWERFSPSHNSALLPFTSLKWLDPAGVLALHIERQARSRRDSPPSSCKQSCISSSASPVVVLSSSPVLCSGHTRFRPPPFHFFRKYLQECSFFPSSIRGRGRQYSPPWWSIPSPVLSPVVHTLASAPTPSLPSRLSFPVSLPSSVYSLPPRARCCTLSVSPPSVQPPPPQDLAIGMLDTGANLPISHPSLASLLQLSPRLWSSPVPIKFGNSTDAVSTHFLHLGPFLGRVALVSSATSTIITKRALHAQGISVLFGATGLCRLILDADESVIYETVLPSPDDFFMIPLVALLPPPLAVILQSSLDAPSSVVAPPPSLSPVANGSSPMVNGRRSLPPVTQSEVAEVMSLHERMYHPSSATMARALRSGAWLGVSTCPTLVERVFAHRDCLFCALGKMKRLPRSPGSSLSPVFGHEVSVDYVPVTTPALGGFTGAYIFVERSSGYAWAYLLKESTKARALFQAISYVRSSLLRYHHQLGAVRTDAGRVETSATLASQLAELHIVINAAAPSAQYQNFVERFIQTAIHGIATSLLAQPHLDNSFWALALQAWIGAWNCRPNSSCVVGSPVFALTGRHPDVSVRFQFPFGAPVSSRTLETRAHPFKFAPSGELGYVVGNTESINGASLVFFPGKSTTQVFPRVDLQLLKLPSPSLTRLELGRHLSRLQVDSSGLTLPVVPRSSPPVVPPSSSSSPASLLHDEDPAPSPISVGDLVHADSAHELLSPPVLSVPAPLVVPTPPSSPLLAPSSSPPLTPVPSDDSSPSPSPLDLGETFLPSDETPSTSVPDSPPLSPVSVDVSPAMNTRSKRTIHQVVQQSPPPSSSPPSIRDSLSDTPTVARALKSSRAPEWRAAIEVELNALLNHGTGEEVSLSSLPRGTQVLPVKIVLKLKRDSEGVPTKFKARLVVLGNLQKSVPANVFSPTANDKSLKLLIALATALRLPLLSLDVYGAFLYPTQSSEVFITIPPLITGGTSVVWQLKKTMYGLAASPRAFYDHVSDHLLVCGYHRCASDPCFFWSRSSSGFLLAVVHVDDFVVAASTPALLARFVRDMELTYVVSVTHDVQHFLGLHTQEFPCGARLMSQPGLLTKLFDKHPSVADLPRFPSVPMSSLFNDDTQSDSPPCDRTAYMELLGSLLFLVKTRPDISFAVNRLSMRSTVATQADLAALHRILAFLYHTRTRGITLRPMVLPAHMCLAAWCDASYALHSDGRSQTGYAFTFVDSQSGMFYSRSTKQSNVTLSSTEAELYAAVEATKDIIWFRGLLAEIGFPQTSPTPLYVDNASMMVLASSYSGNHKRVKHFLVRLNFLIEAVALGTIAMVKVDTLVNLADTLTKALGPIAFTPKSAALLGNPPLDADSRS
jgi:hypothetical protein